MLKLAATMATIISMFSLKGGVGKSTLALNLYTVYHQKGVSSIALYDADEQKSITNLVHKIPELSHINIVNNFQEAMNQYDLVIVDTPPYFEETVMKLILPNSDMVIVPCRPSVPDTLSLSFTIDKIKEVQKVNTGLKAYILINQLITGNKFAGEVKKIIKGYGLPSLSTTVGQRIAFQKAMLSGSLYKERNSQAIQELEALANEIYTTIKLYS